MGFSEVVDSDFNPHHTLSESIITSPAGLRPNRKANNRAIPPRRKHGACLELTISTEGCHTVPVHPHTTYSPLLSAACATLPYLTIRDWDFGTERETDSKAGNQQSSVVLTDSLPAQFPSLLCQDHPLIAYRIFLALQPPTAKIAFCDLQSSIPTLSLLLAAIAPQGSTVS